MESKRADESFSEAVERMLNETRANWQEFVGTLDDEDVARAKELIGERREPSIRATKEGYRELFGQ